MFLFNWQVSPFDSFNPYPVQLKGHSYNTDEL